MKTRRIEVPSSLSEEEAALALEVMAQVKASQRADIAGFVTLANDIGRRQAARAAADLVASAYDDVVDDEGGDTWPANVSSEQIVRDVIERTVSMFDKDDA
jgi:hypothetical protein